MLLLGAENRAVGNHEEETGCPDPIQQILLKRLVVSPERTGETRSTKRVRQLYTQQNTNVTAV